MKHSQGVGKILISREGIWLKRKNPSGICQKLLGTSCWGVLAEDSWLEIPGWGFLAEESLVRIPDWGILAEVRSNVKRKYADWKSLKSLVAASCGCKLWLQAVAASCGCKLWLIQSRFYKPYSCSNSTSIFTIESQHFLLQIAPESRGSGLGLGFWSLGLTWGPSHDLSKKCKFSKGKYNI